MVYFVYNKQTNRQVTCSSPRI